MNSVAQQMKAGAVMRVAGAALWPDWTGALFWLDESALMVADLHLEKGSAYAARGQFLPPYDSASTLLRLESALQRFSPRHVIALGDTFHDKTAEARLAPETAQCLTRLVAMTPRWTWIAGNHDPAPGGAFGGEIQTGLKLGPLTLTHEPAPGAAPGEVAGHLHPVARLSTPGRRVRRRCFVADATRVVLPAFGAYAGGLDVADEAFAALFPGAFHAFMLSARQVYAVPSSRLCL